MSSVFAVFRTEFISILKFLSPTTVAWMKSVLPFLACAWCKIFCLYFWRKKDCLYLLEELWQDSSSFKGCIVELDSASSHLESIVHMTVQYSMRENNQLRFLSCPKMFEIVNLRRLSCRHSRGWRESIYWRNIIKTKIFSQSRKPFRKVEDKTILLLNKH